MTTPKERIALLFYEVGLLGRRDRDGAIAYSLEAPLEASADVLAADSLEGRYAIERELGEGGMATVYLADDL